MRKQLESLLSELPGSITWASLRSTKLHANMISARNGKPEDVREDISAGYMLEILEGGQFLYAARPHFDKDSIKETALMLQEMGRKLNPYRLYEFSDSVRPPSKGEYLGKGYHSVSLDDRNRVIDAMMQYSGFLKDGEDIVLGTAHTRILETVTDMVSTSGASFTQKILQIGGDLRATASKDSVTQTRTYSSLESRSYQQSVDEYLSEISEKTCKRIREEARELTTAMECPTGIFPVLIMPDQLYLQIHESIGHPLELDRILGDERNYAGWSFIKPEDFGSLQYGSKLMNVSFDPEVSGELASARFDDCGVPTQKEFIIKDGVLLRGLGSLESQERSGLKGVSCQRSCSWNRAPIDRMANLNLEPGDSSLDDMISSVEYGILMKSNRSWSIDDYRNKFQFGCEYGKLIEHGKLTKTLKNPNYRGVTTPFWNQLSMVGNEDTVEILGTPFCGKGEPNQSIYVGHATPACLFDNLEVFGGSNV